MSLVERVYPSGEFTWNFESLHFEKSPSRVSKAQYASTTWNMEKLGEILHKSRVFRKKDISISLENELEGSSGCLIFQSIDFIESNKTGNNLKVNSLEKKKKKKEGSGISDSSRLLFGGRGGFRQLARRLVPALLLSSQKILSGTIRITRYVTHSYLSNGSIYFLRIDYATDFETFFWKELKIERRE